MADRHTRSALPSVKKQVRGRDGGTRRVRPAPMSRAGLETISFQTSAQVPSAAPAQLIRPSRSWSRPPPCDLSSRTYGVGKR
eukprot:746616-Hanusia_phi.AAC.3